MNDLDNNAIDRLLAPLCGRDAHYFRPASDRNDLAEVLGKLTAEQVEELVERLAAIQECPDDISPYTAWLLTCDPSIIARAVAEVVRGAQTPGEGGAQ